MRQTLSDFNGMNDRLPAGLEIVGDDGEHITLHRRSFVSVSRNGGLIWTWRSEDGATQLAYCQHIRCDEHGQARVERFFGIVSQLGVASPDTAMALAHVFMPDDSIIMEFRPFRAGWPPALIGRDQLRYIDNAQTRPGLN